jgi:tRNA-binding protein
VAGFTSQFLLVGFSDEHGAICLITVDPYVGKGVPNGQKLH